MRIPEILLFSLLLAAIVVSDLRRLRIPNGLILSGIFIRLLSVTLAEGVSSLPALLFHSLFVSVPVAVITLIIEAVTKKKILGGGDLKLVFFLGLYVPWQAGILAVIIALSLGIVVAALCRRQRKRLPLAPAIAAAFLAAIKYQSYILEWWERDGSKFL